MNWSCILLHLFRWWLLAASDDKHKPVVEAETALAFLYSRKNSLHYNLKKAFQWHSRASQHGSLESLGKTDTIL